MLIRKRIKADFGVDLPISGGFGNSADNAVVIEKTIPNDYVATEYAYLKCLGIGRSIEWKLISQQLIDHNGRTLDKIKIETIKTTAEQIITQNENYYFDISECIK